MTSMFSRNILVADAPRVCCVIAIWATLALPAYAATQTGSLEKAETAIPSSASICRAFLSNKNSCVVEGYSIELTDCKGDALYGAVAAAAGVDLSSAVAPNGKDVTAHLQNGQFVCIAATARKGGIQRHYVIAVPTASVPGCLGNDLCKDGDKRVVLKQTDAGDACHRLGKDGDYAGQCAAGWVNEADLDQYANGL